MTWRTHVLFGISSLWLLEPLSGVLSADTIGPLAVMAALGALLPDLDAAHSKIKSLEVGGIRPFAPLAWLSHRAGGHRGFLHSPAGLGLVGLFALLPVFMWGWQPSAVLWLGYASHLAADACTRTGIPLWPQNKRWHLLLARLRLVTGSA